MEDSSLHRISATLTLPFWIVSAFFLEFAALLYWIQGQSEILFLTCHFLSAGCTLCASLFLTAFEKRGTLGRIWFGTWLVVPFFGPLSVFPLIVFLYPRIHADPVSVHDLISSMETDQDFIRNTSLNLMARTYINTDQAGFLARRRNQPLADAIFSDDTNIKTKAIGKLRELRDRYSIALLKQAQKDSQYEVQYLATIALSAIEQDWNDKLADIGKQIDFDPYDPKLRIQFLDIVDKIIDSQLFSDKINNTYRESTLGHLQAALEIEPDSPFLWLLKGRIHLSANQIGDAIEAFEQACELDPNNVESRIDLMRSLYIAKDYSKIKKNAEILTSNAMLPSQWVKHVQYWSTQREP